MRGEVLVGGLITATATPPGKGAIGLVRMSGRGARAAAQRFLQLPGELRPRRATLCWAADGAERIDQVLATYFPPAASYTGEEMIEISAHGSPYVLERLLRLARDAGARLARPGEFTQRAYLNGKLDLAQAEAVCELISAQTERAHRAAVSQLAGGLSRRIAALRSTLIELTAQIEAELDHPEEDIPLLPVREAGRRVDELHAALCRLTDSHRRGRLVKRGARIAIVGRPNAGKSTLLNALLGRERAIVSARPGTTRDTIEESAEIAGYAAVLVDTAGLLARAKNAVEREGQRRTRRELERADLALWVLDRTVKPGRRAEVLRDLSARTRTSERGAIAVLNKCDREPAGLTPRHIGGGVPALEISARTGAGLPELVRSIRRALENGGGAEQDEVLVASERHYALLCAARDGMAAARTVLGEDERRGELAAASLRRALGALDEILGTDAPEAVLAEIFSRFCIGK
ncbi:MAG: tRNA uridine-5-carboxymethylaminomethyl(34) synthesis GTPase MnmE [Elusimicrobiota bacterium]